VTLRVAKPKSLKDKKKRISLCRVSYENLNYPEKAIKISINKYHAKGMLVLEDVDRTIKYILWK
jgi:hypothetical protein